MSYRTDEIDREMLVRLPRARSAVSAQLEGRAAAIVDLVRQGWRWGTVKNALIRLMNKGVVERVWDGNERYGRCLYFVPEQ